MNRRSFFGTAAGIVAGILGFTRIGKADQWAGISLEPATFEIENYCHHQHPGLVLFRTLKRTRITGTKTASFKFAASLVPSLPPGWVRSLLSVERKKDGSFVIVVKDEEFFHDFYS